MSSPPQADGPLHAQDPPARIRIAAEAGGAAGGGEAGERDAAARALARRLGLPLAPTPAAFELLVTGEGLGLRPAGDASRDAARPLRVDFTAARPGGEEVVRAVRGRRGTRATGVVADATAGLGVDAGALARAGLRVVLIERDPILHALLDDALARLAASAEPTERAMAERMRLRHGDAVVELARLRPPPDVVYLDPMYPDTGGGAKRRGMRWVRAWLGERGGGDPSDLLLLEAARSVARTRVVLKRPVRAPPLAPGVSGSMKGRTTRFDLYPPAP